MPGWCLFVATFGPSQKDSTQEEEAGWLWGVWGKGLGSAGPHCKVPTSNCLQGRKPTMGPQIPSESGRRGVGQAVGDKRGLSDECAEPSVGQNKALRGLHHPQDKSRF